MVLSFLLYVSSLFVVLNARNYRLFDYDEMVEKVVLLGERFPELIKVTTAQEEYGLDSPGRCGQEACLQHIIHLTNFDTYEDEKATRPEVFLSGALHGNERVGPTAVVETIELLASNYFDSKPNPWLKRLVDTRSIYVMPAANALGFYQDRRTENGIDPNRDFAFDREDQECMETQTARALNELWRDHMFQLAITYHSGLRMIGYMWGDRTNGDDFFTSPDQFAQASIGTALSAYAGTFDEWCTPVYNNVPDFSLYERFTYPNGPITPLLYPVNGGMEDWAYGGSWAPQKNTCRPKENPDYPEEKTEYTDAMLRCINILVETDDDNDPPPSTLGSTEELLRASGRGQGHVPRMIRLALIAIEAVQPYIKYTSFYYETKDDYCDFGDTFYDISEEIVEFDDVNGGKIIRNPTPNELVSMSYEVGGSFKVSSTYLSVFEKPADFEEQQITAEVIKELEPFKLFDTELQTGYTRWGGGGLFGSRESEKDQNIFADYTEMALATRDGIDDREEFPFIPAWKSCFRAPRDEGEYLVIAQAIVDREWGDVPRNASPAGYRSQSHLVQARTNPDWKKTNNGFVVEGNINWYSSPLYLVVDKERLSETKVASNFDVAILAVSSIGCLGAFMILAIIKRSSTKENVVDVDHYLGTEVQAKNKASL